ncbi:MAG: hypothetical protein ACK457_03305 [Flavobacteriia bacterium]|jgi:hypothetical protein
MEEIIEWIGEFLVGLIIDSRRGLWLLVGIVLTVFGIVQINRSGEVTLAVFFLVLGLFSFFMCFRKFRKKKSN